MNEGWGRGGAEGAAGGDVGWVLAEVAVAGGVAPGPDVRPAPCQAHESKRQGLLAELTCTLLALLLHKLWQAWAQRAVDEAAGPGERGQRRRAWGRTARGDVV